MSQSAYAYRLKQVVTLLDASEWPEIEDLLRSRLLWIQGHRRDTGCSIPEAAEREPIGQIALDRYEELTGHRLAHPDQLWHVEMARYGSLCPSCARPFRTPKAKLCAECGYVLPDGMIAGPLEPAGKRGNFK